ncbi:rRNA maturation RNase YbeY [Neisseria sp. Ec49-e6-T10]|uniref:rRNA maturation RNase YbeY n=1 Tax=Neisseria sp. Ec49-e6-T10 TaxID=3140744 RepID=UPI003EBF8959
MKKAKKYPFLSIQRKRLNLYIQKETSSFVPSEQDFFKWVWQAIKNHYSSAQINILLADEALAKQYNHDFRHKDYATNVLSFPSEDAGFYTEHTHALQGDLIICPQVVEKEAKEQNKTIQAHYAHLTIHGVLHLMGYDHENEQDAEHMEMLEISILNQLGYTNPYFIQE